MIVHSYSLLGKRPSNEDAHVAIKNINKNKKNMRPINFFSVFDGHGGKAVSAYLKENYHKFFLSNYWTDDLNNSNLVKNYIKKVHNCIQGKLSNKNRNISYSIGSTCLSCMFYKDKNKKINYYITNLGDCRAVLCNSSDQAVALTEDHKPNSIEERQRIEKLGGSVYYDHGVYRVANLSVSRAFGDIDATPFLTHIPKVKKFKLKKDKFMILACDGLWDALSNQQAVNFVLKKIKNLNVLGDNHSKNRNNIAKQLGEHAINKGSYDNVSIIIVFF